MTRGIGAEAEDSYVHGIVHMEEDAATCWLIEMKLHLASVNA